MCSAGCPLQSKYLGRAMDVLAKEISETLLASIERI
jgi:hypothetical protein